MMKYPLPPETKRSDQLAVLSDEWTSFVAEKRGEYVELASSGNDATLPTLERFLGAAIAARIMGG